MKAAIICAIGSIVLLSCSQPPKVDEATTRRADAILLYQKNLAVLKLGLQAFQDEQMDVWADGVSDTVKWNSAAYGASVGSKEDWKKSLSGYVTNWDSIRLKSPIFLPGVDTASFEPDGSVRYYGTWTAIHSSGVRTSVNFYGSYDFNNDNKITGATDFFDYGGLMNSLMPKSK